MSRASRCVTASVSRSMLDDARGDVMTARHPARAALAAICTAQHVRGIRNDVSPPGPGPLLSVVVVSYCDSSLRVHRGSPQGAKKAANGGSLSAPRARRLADARASPPRVFLHFGRAVPVARVRRVWQVQVYRRRAVGPAPACLWAVNGPCCVYTVPIAVRFDGCSLQRGPGRAAGA